MQEFTDFALKNLIQLAIDSGASDIHLSSGTLPALRVHGELNYVKSSEIFMRETLEKFVSEILTPAQLERFTRSGDLDFAFTFGTQRFRGSLYREMRGLSLTFRLVPSIIRSLDELGLPEILKTMAYKHRGLFLATGPTGHGKSSTLAAIISEINRNAKSHIVTIEDPIEYVHTPALSVIHQREVGADTENFASGIRHVLRQDPDVIMIGEMRDLETISAAITAAETGHLVFGTLHTQDASQSIERIVDVFPPHQQNQIRLQLSYTLLGICSQQLIPTQGVKGRVCATEILITTPAIRASIREGKISSIRNAMLTGMAFGMHTMEQDLSRLFHDGRISQTTAKDFAYDRTEIERLLAMGM
ncbi:MAG: PilT/PilU family type 4a pilus ATPase [Synergistaceae bacterium]|nr:PilT/PilU family type 4a pilus ATPase [Synergistaceae bacterium]MBR0094855.1 PilT/PilU family type 4a pilus ATPase [Synergistaceae bacterium]